MKFDIPNMDLNIEYFSDGTEKKSVEVKDGVRNGKALKYHANGTLKLICHYKDDKCHGEYKKYNCNGVLICQREYVEGRPFGRMLMYNDYGLLIEDSDNTNGVYEGVKYTYYNDGKLANKIFFKGELNCKEIIYHRDGSEYVTREFNTKNILYFNNEKQDFQEGIKHIMYDTFENQHLFRITSMLDNHDRECALKDGAIEVWKVCRVNVNGQLIYVYVRLLVPKEAKRITPFDGLIPSYKSRVEYAKVIEIIDTNGTRYHKASSFIFKDKTIDYVLGDTVYADGIDTNPYNECGRGIHVHCYKDQCDMWVT